MSFGTRGFVFFFEFSNHNKVLGENMIVAVMQRMSVSTLIHMITSSIIMSHLCVLTLITDSYSWDDREKTMLDARS